MKKQFVIINKGKGVLNINPSNLNKVEQPITALDALYEYVDTKDDEVLDAANTYTDNSISIVNNTITEIDDRLINLEYPDAILRRGSITLDNTTVKIPAYSFLIRINQREITNPTAYSGLITPATDGYNRIDIITINELGYFTKVTGVESLSIAVKPQPLPNTLEITSINIKGNVISPPVVTDTAKLDRGGYTGGSAMTLYQEITALDEAITTRIDDIVYEVVEISLPSKEDKNQKGVANGYAPLNEFVKIANEYLNIVNDLVTGGATNLLSAQQGVALQLQITAINTILSSDDINLDTIQELVDAIKTVETSLETILVNDLTTGGTTKALTAEMGKTLKGLIDNLQSTWNTISGNQKTINLSGFTDDIGATELQIIKVTNKSQIINQVLDVSKKYSILTNLVLGDGEFINMDNSPLIEGLGADFTNITTTSTTGVIFKSTIAQNVNIKNISLSATAVGSKVFELKDANANFGTSVGIHEFRLVGVNFDNCRSLGFVDGFRQWFSIDLGIYNCYDGIEMRGVWNGMFFDQANMFGIITGATFFKQGLNLSFVDRCIFQANFNVPTGVVFMNFMPSVFQDSEALQINNTVAKVAGVKNQTNAVTLFPNIGANNPKSLWGINTGLPSTARELIIINNAVAGSFVINWLNDTYDLTLTANTTFTEINLPASGRRTKTLNITIAGNFEPTFPPAWELNKIGTFKKGELNSITIKFISVGKYAMKIDNSLTVYPAPRLGSIFPLSLSPSSTTPLRLNGSFFTPQSIVKLQGQNVNTITFDDDTGSLDLGVTTGAAEGEFNIEISNGTNVVYIKKLPVLLGTVYTPIESDWSSNTINIDLSVSGEARLKVANQLNSANWLKLIPANQNFRLLFQIDKSPFVSAPAGSYSNRLNLVKASDLAPVYGAGVYGGLYDNPNFMTYLNGTSVDFSGGAGTYPIIYEIRRVDGHVSVYENGVIRRTFVDQTQVDMYIQVQITSFDIVSIKYVVPLT